MKNESNLKFRKLNSDQESKEWNEENGWAWATRIVAQLDYQLYF